MISFIVLHYKNLEDTLKCLECIKRISIDDTSIIVVDNNSLDENSICEIKNYTDDIILLDKNYGFAKANNIGIKYAKDKYNSSFYCVINNDVFITQEDFIKRIEDDYSKYKFDMLGTWIDSPSGESVNPFPAIVGEGRVKQEIEECNRLIRIYNSSVLFALLSLYIKIKHLFKKPVVGKNGNELSFNVALHGCGIIFSYQYLNKYNDAFYNGTFLFHEEEFLYERVLRDNLISMYDPSIKIFHKEGSSVKKTNKSVRMGKLFREKERLKSLELLLSIMKTGE